MAHHHGDVHETRIIRALPVDVLLTVVQVVGASLLVANGLR